MKSLTLDLKTVTYGPASLQDPHECNQDHCLCTKETATVPLKLVQKTKKILRERI